MGPMEQRNIFDAIRGAYDLGYNDARNARAVPGDSAPGYDGRSVEADHGGALFNTLNRRLSAAQPAPVPAPVASAAIPADPEALWNNSVASSDWEAVDAYMQGVADTEAHHRIAQQTAPVPQPSMRPYLTPEERRDIAELGDLAGALVAPVASAAPSLRLPGPHEVLSALEGMSPGGMPPAPAPAVPAVPEAVAALSKNLKHSAIVVSDWMREGCDTNDIPRPHIAVLVSWAKESAHLALSATPKPEHGEGV